MLVVLFQHDIFRKIAHFAVNAHTHIAALAQLLKILLELTLAILHDWRENVQARARLQRHDLVHHLVDRLLMDLFAAFWAVRHADARVKQTQIIVDLGDSADGGTRIAAGGFLIDRDRRRKPGDLVDVWFVHLS